MDDIEIIRCEIQSEIYERQIKVLIEQLLKIDEAIQKSENEITVGTSVTEPTEIKKAAA
jgi:hypothetical protein